MKPLLLCLAVLIVMAAPCAAQDPRGPFADVPTDHWAYQDVDVLQKAGIVIGYPDDTVTGRRIMTRDYFATNIARLLSQMSGSQPTLRANIEMRLLASPSAIYALQDLILHFKPELMRLNVSVNTIQAHLAQMAQVAAHPLAAKPFSDVPLTHWAASAIETLRVNRIFAGYPQGTFTVME